MIRFESVRVTNFALFPDLTLAFSVAPEQPLTILRGENESGKTTLMRAFVWALFGKESLPKVANVRHPVRPVWAKPGEVIRTRVEVKFRSEAERGSTSFKLSRTIETSDDGSVVSDGPEVVHFLRRDGDDWTDQEDQLQILLKRFFRPEMRDFYFIDADKAVDFVGGPEGRHSDQLMRDTTTQAIRGLLGLDVMLRARERLDDRQLAFSRTAGSQSGSAEQQRLANELADIQGQLDVAKSKLNELRAEEAQQEEIYRNIEREFEDRLSKLEEIEVTNKQFDEVTKQLGEARAKQSELVNALVALLDDERLYAGLMLPIIDSTMAELQPLKDKGYIPPTELTLLPRLLDRGECVCGVDLRQDHTRRRHLEQQIERARSTKERSHFYDTALETARRLGNRALGQSDLGWRNELEATTTELSELDPTIARLVDEHDALRERREQGGSGGALRELKKHRDELRLSLDTTKERCSEHEQKVNELQKDARSLSERIRTAATAEKRTQMSRVSADVAEHLSRLISTAYESVEREQVTDVSHSMNRIFRDVISATPDSLFGEVGIRSAATTQAKRQYEVYALEGGREKPLALANGASRRAIGVAFVLALAEETGTSVPLVADSLLHALSGAVKRKVVEYLTQGDRVGQPVLFGTRTDFLDEEVRAMLKARAGRSYTLTAQVHAGGDVVRASPHANCPRQVVVCACSVDEFCPACERTGETARAEHGRLTGYPTSKELLT